MRFTRRNRALRKTGWAAPGDRPRPRGDGSSIHRETRGDAARASRCFTLLTSTCGVADHSTGSEQVNGTGLRVRGLLVLMTVLGTACALLMQGCEKSLPPGTRAERIVIEKAARRLTIYRAIKTMLAVSSSSQASPTGSRMARGERVPVAAAASNAASAVTAYEGREAMMPASGNARRGHGVKRPEATS